MLGQLLLAKSWCVEEKDENNYHDIYAVSVMKSMMKDSVVVGHLPRKISLVDSLFLIKGGRNDHVSSAWRLACMCLKTFSILAVTKFSCF